MISLKYIKNEQGVSLIELVASIVIISIILISFFGLFLQSKKTHVASETIVDTTYHAQQEMEEIYGFVSANGANWLKDSTNTELSLQGEIFTYDPTNSDCTGDCKRFLSPDDPNHWIQLQENPVYPTSLVNVVVNVPKNNSSTPVMMESIFRWGIRP